MTDPDDSGERDTGTTGSGETDTEIPDTGAETDPIDRTGPLSDLATAADERRATDRNRERDGDAASRPPSGPDFDELFDREDVTEIDAERLWAALEADDSAPPGGFDDRKIREIDGGSYCHQCEHFSEPPVVACTREETDILELPALETFRVADCPVVLEDERLERGH